MTKKLYLISKTHLDLGFTDYAENIYRLYLNDYIPRAIDIANEVNADGVTRFVWTTGSYILREALRHSTDKDIARLEQAMQKGYIRAHALPFTMHTELLDKDTFRHGLDIARDLDTRFGRTTIAAKVTDVPGHTIAMVPLLAEYGIRLLHIGVNEASAVPDVPDVFLWKYGDAEVVVIYDKSYGGVFSCPYIEDKMIFSHTGDNCGPKSAKKVLADYNAICREYPDYDIVPGGLDDMAAALWAVREQLPVVTMEIGDSWIHGSTTDPFKIAALGELIRMKNNWLADGSLSRDSEEYECLADNLLLIAEHTNGLDTKRYFADYSHYLKEDFNAARNADHVRMPLKTFFRDVSQNFATLLLRLFGTYRRGSYSALEKSWLEQRFYIDKALAKMSPAHLEEIEQHLNTLNHTEMFAPTETKYTIGTEVSNGRFTMSVGECGAVSLRMGDTMILSASNDQTAVDYFSYCSRHYDYWLNHYTRDLDKTRSWALGDFARPGLNRLDDRFPNGLFHYSVTDSYTDYVNGAPSIIVLLSPPEDCWKLLGAPRYIGIRYTLTDDGLTTELVWTEKDASRLSEATSFRLYPYNSFGSLRYTKLGQEINPFSVVSNGNRNLSAVEKVSFGEPSHRCHIVNNHCPIVCIGESKILRFDNLFHSVDDEGISYILHNNVWGTNFPLWYQDDAYFRFDIVVTNEN